MLRQCITLALMGYVMGLPAPKPQHQYQQQSEGVPPHLLRQFLASQQLAHADQTPGPSIPARAPHHAPARLPYAVQTENQYQPQVQYQPQPQQQPQPQPQYRPQAQYQAKPQEQREPQEDYDPHPSYQFGFDVNDDQYTNYQNRKEERDGDVIKGSYSVVDSDGFIRTVTYTADPKEGFKAEVSRQPTDIVVKIPTPKPQTLQPQIGHGQPQISHAQPQISHAQPQVTHAQSQYSHAQPQVTQAQPQYAQVQQQPQQAPQYYRYQQ